MNKRFHDPPGIAEQTYNISLIVPNLNEEPYLRKFLQSLHAQYVKDFELIIIDGGSVDDSRLIVDEFEQLHPEISIVKLISTVRNIGFIRNLGAMAARGEILFHTSSDVVLDPWMLQKVLWHFKDPTLVSLTGRTKPISSSALSHIAYQSFDLLRWFFTKLPNRLMKYRPGGNFLVIRKKVFEQLGGFPEVAINEDGLLGQRIDYYVYATHGFWVCFDLDLCVHHHVKRFEVKGGIKTVLFYFYVLGNMFPFLKPLLDPIERNSAAQFKTRSDLKSRSRR